MDISSGNVAFGSTCPGTVMQDLQRDEPEKVAKIKKLQTSFSSHEVTWLCPIASKDLSVVTNFIESIDALEQLSVLVYEHDGATLFPSVLHHAKSLNSLSIHTPPQNRPHVWTPTTVQLVASSLPHLRHLELDVGLEEVESFLADAEPSPSHPVIDELTKMRLLESAVVNVTLQDAACAFADEHTWTAMGCTKFPNPNKKPCEKLAQRLFDQFRADAPEGCALRRLEVRFPRRCWDDRCQFWTLSYSVHVRRDEAGTVTVEPDEGWVGGYLPEQPKYGDYLWTLMMRQRGFNY